jgi:hypothetical protein
VRHWEPSHTTVELRFWHRLGVFTLAIFPGFICLLSGILLEIPGSWAYAAAFLVYGTVLVVPVLIRGRNVEWFHPVTITSVVGIVGIYRMYPVFFAGLPWHRGLPGKSPGELGVLLGATILLMAFARVCYYAGFSLRLPVGIPRVIERPKLGFWARTLILVSVSVTAVFVYLTLKGGVSAHLANMALGRSRLIDEGQLSGEWTLVGRAAVFGCLFLILLGRSELHRRIGVLIGVFTVSIQYLITGSRSSVVFSGAILLLAWMIWRRRIAVMRLATYFLVSILIVGALGVIRVSSWEGRRWHSQIRNSRVTDLFGKGRGELTARSTSHNPLLGVVSRVPNDVDLLLGKSYIALATFPVPRALWKNKPRSVGADAGRIFLGTPAPAPIGAVGEAFWNFHIPGVAAAFVAFGVFHRWLLLLIRNNPRSSFVVALYTVSIVFFSGPEVFAILRWIYSCAVLGAVALVVLKFRVSVSARDGQ